MTHQRRTQFDPEQVKAWVEQSRLRQGLPPVLNDPIIIDKVVRILREHRRLMAIHASTRPRVTSR